MKLKGKNIWITGSSGGIGLAMALEAVRQRAACVLLSGSRPEKLEQALAACRQCAESQEKPGGKTELYSICFDIGKAQQVDQAAEQLWQHVSRLDILVHNAGVSQRSAMLDTDLPVERRLMEINYWGAVALSKRVLPRMLQNPRCYIGVTSSVTGLFGVPLRSTYCASKHALHGYFMALLTEYHRCGLRLCLLCPGKVDTEISKSALVGDGSPLGIVEKGHASGLSAHRCAQIFWRGLKKGRLLCYAARAELFAIWLHRVSPQLGSALIRKVLPLKENPDAKERKDSRW